MFKEYFCQMFTGGRSIFEFPRRVNLFFPSLYCSWLYGQDYSRCNKVDVVRLYASYRLNLLLLKGHRWCIYRVLEKWIWHAIISKGGSLEITIKSPLYFSYKIVSTFLKGYKPSDYSLKGIVLIGNSTYFWSRNMRCFRKIG